MASVTCSVICLLRRPAAVAVARAAPQVPEDLARDGVQHSWPAYRDALAALLDGNPLPAWIAAPAKRTTVILGDRDRQTPASDVMDFPRHAVDGDRRPSDEDADGDHDPVPGERERPDLDRRVDADGDGGQGLHRRRTVAAARLAPGEAGRRGGGAARRARRAGARRTPPPARAAVRRGHRAPRAQGGGRGGPPGHPAGEHALGRDARLSARDLSEQLGSRSTTAWRSGARNRRPPRRAGVGVRELAGGVW